MSDTSGPFGPKPVSWLKKLAEQAVVTFGSAFVATVAATNGSITKAALVAAVGAGLRAAYGFVVRNLGETNTPSAL